MASFWILDTFLCDFLSSILLNSHFSRLEKLQEAFVIPQYIVEDRLYGVVLEYMLCHSKKKYNKLICLYDQDNGEIQYGTTDYVASLRAQYHNPTNIH